MNRYRSTLIAILVFFGLLVMLSSVFIITERQNGIVLQFGEVRQVVRDPGLYFKIPFLQTVQIYDARIQTIDTDDSQLIITSEKKNVLVDYFIKWRVINPEVFYTSVQGNEAFAVSRLSQNVASHMREEFGRRTMHEVISGQRQQLMRQIQSRSNEIAQTMGIEILDVRVKRVELPDDVTESVYRRMEAERKRVANELRSQGAAEAETIRADADRQREIILANAYGQAQSIRGEGDAEAASIYADGFNKNPEFFAFYRSMEAYRNSFKSDRDILVLDPNSDYFKYMRSPNK